MASTASPHLLQTLPLHRVRSSHPSSHKPHASKPSPLPTTSLSNRRHFLFSLTAGPALLAREPASIAEDIPLFGLRKKLKKAEEVAEEIVREGFETAEKGLETAERGIVSVEKGIERAEKGVETAEREIEEEAARFGAVAQAGTVAGAEFLGVVVATSIVNGILGPDS